MVVCRNPRNNLFSGTRGVKIKSASQIVENILWCEPFGSRVVFVYPIIKPLAINDILIYTIPKSRIEIGEIADDLEFLMERVSLLPTRKEQALKPLYTMIGIAAIIQVFWRP
jgi:hypothetical protein